MILLTPYSCSKMEKTKNDLAQKTKSKVYKASKIVWKKSIEKLFEHTTIIKPSKFEDIFRKNTDLEIKNQKGKEVEYVANFHQYFFKYTAEKDKLLQFLDNMKSTRPEISDQKHSTSDKQIIDDKLHFIKSKFPDIYRELAFFREFESKDGLEYYSVNKYPYSNIIIYDKMNNVIYHFVENYQN